MCKSKPFRLLCLLCALFVFFGSFGLSASAASEGENLIDSNLRNWDKYNPDFTLVSVPFYDGDSPVYQITFKPIKIDDADFWLRNGALYDISNLKAGSSYTFNFHLYDYNELTKLGFSSSEAWLYNGLLQYGGTLVVGLGYYSPTDDTVYGLDDYAFYITKDNYKDYYGRDNTFSFVMPNIQNACIMIGYLDIYETGNTVPFYFSNISLVDNEQAKEEGFLSKLFQFFHDLKWELIGGDCEDPSCPKNPHKSLPEKLGDLIKSLFIPDEQFITTWKSELEVLLDERLGIIWDAGDFFITLIQTIGDLLTTTADDIHYELPEMVVELNGQSYTLWQAQQVDFSFLEKNAFFAFLYNLYKAILNVFLGIPLLNYAKKELDATLHN